MNAVSSRAERRLVRKAENRRLRKRMVNMWQLYLMVVVGVAFFIVFRYATMYGVLIAFKNFKARRGIWGSEWVGFKNFVTVFGGREVGRVFANTIQISLMKLLTGFPAPIILAILLNEIYHPRFKKTVSSLLYMPHFLSWTVFGGILFSLFSQATGSIPMFVLNTFGYQMPSLITDPKYARAFLYASNIWKEVGWSTIIYTAAIAGIDQQLYESALIDGANHFQEIWHITLPCIRITIATLLVLDVGNIMSAGFDQIFNLHTNMNAAKNTVEIIDTYVYESGVKNGKFAYSAVVGITKSAINAVLLVIANFAAGKLTGESPL